MKTYTLKDITAFNPLTLFTIGRSKRVYEYIGSVTDNNSLYSITIAVLYDGKAQKYNAVDLLHDKRANDAINIIYQY